jgi:uroporphyrinogen-III synthase
VKAGLYGLSVIVTRPADQADPLAGLVERAGGRPVIFPTIEIRARRFDEAMSRQLRGLSAADWVIFVSHYAARCGLECIRLAGAELAGIRIATMGKATTRTLSRAGERVALECPPPPGSESLLSTGEMRNVAGKTVFIVRGKGGRELLGRTLRERGAAVEYLECYERLCPRASIDPVADAVAADRRALFVTTSVTGLENLISMAQRQQRGEILDARLIVAAGRQLQEATRLGWRGTVTAARDAGDAAIMDRLLELARAANDQG